MTTKITLRNLRRCTVDRLIVESVDLSLYIAHACVEGEQRLIAGEDGKPLKTRNLLEMKAALSVIKAQERVLVQRSAYDEMVGHAHSSSDNLLEIPLEPGFETLPSWQH